MINDITHLTSSTFIIYTITMGAKFGIKQGFSVRTEEDKIESYLAIEGIKERFLSYFAKYGNISEACLHAGVHRRTTTRWRDEDPKFKDGFQLAYQEYVDSLRSRVRERSYHNDTILMFEMKRHDKEYVDNHILEITTSEKAQELLQALREFRQHRLVEVGLPNKADSSGLTEVRLLPAIVQESNKP